MDSDEDTRSEIESLRLLTNALEFEKLDERSCCEESQASVSTSSPTDASKPGIVNVSKIETALAINKLMDQKLRKLESILNNRLESCREKLREMHNLNTAEKETECYKNFRYTNCGNPYFKDSNYYSAPPNADAEIMAKSDMCDLVNAYSVVGWTVKDKRSFVAVLLTISRDIKEKECRKQISELKNTLNDDNRETVQENIKNLENYILELKNKTLDELALPIEEEYDWELIRQTLNFRHTKSEYRSLWKLFLHPSINKEHWTKKEQMHLLSLVKEHNNQDWELIAKKLGTGRTGYQCFVYYRTHKGKKEGNQKWTKEEEEYLRRIVEYYKENDFIPWSKIVSKIPNRTKIQIYNKYLLLVGKKGRYLKEEDNVILACVETFGPNFKKMAKYLSGRTPTQLRYRYNIIKSKRISTTWSIEEDKRLLQLIPKGAENAVFADLTKHFPGKTRAQLRTRYVTLLKWIKKHPMKDLEKAPRRGARRLYHGSEIQDLPTALEELKNKIEGKSNEDNRLSKIITIESSEQMIDDSIMVTLANEDFNYDFKMEKLKQSIVYPSSSKEHSQNLFRLLALLKARLNKDLFTVKRSGCGKYPELLQNVSDINLMPMISYSKKEKYTVVTPSDPANIWGEKVLVNTSYVLPPQLCTINGLQNLMIYMSTVQPGELKDVKRLCAKNVVFKQQWARLLERFHSLFIWPMLLSDIWPKKIATATWQQRSLNDKYYNLTIPNAYYKNKMRKLKSRADNVAIDNELMEKKVKLT